MYTPFICGFYKSIVNGKNASFHSLGIYDTLSEGHFFLALLITLVPINTGTFEYTW